MTTTVDKRKMRIRIGCLMIETASAGVVVAAADESATECRYLL